MSATQRVLLVDDHESWRQQVRFSLQESRRWRVIAEAADGFTAIHKALVLNPACILLDVQLPGLNGLEAARRILAVKPNARILFVTLHRSLDVAEAALATGAQGYRSTFSVGWLASVAVCPVTDLFDLPGPLAEVDRWIARYRLFWAARLHDLKRAVELMPGPSAVRRSQAVSAAEHGVRR